MNRNQNILITGATSGIGAALALYYAKTSAKTLFLCGRDESRLKTITQKCTHAGAVVFSQIVDVTDKDAVKNWILACEEKANINLVIANAGVATLQENTENIYKTFDTNIYGVLNTVLPTLEIYRNRLQKQTSETSSLDKFISKMKKQKRAFSISPFTKKYLGNIGCELYNTDNKAIAIVSSIAGYHGLPTCPSYSASKACIKAWGEALRLMLKPSGIRVSVICPGFVRSRITDKNTCPMPFFWEADKAAKVIATRLEKNIGLIAFPWQLRFVTWLISILPNKISDFIYSRLPHKV